MRTRAQPGPLTRLRLWWNGWRDARGGLSFDEAPPRASTFESVASSRCYMIALGLERGLERSAARVARLQADHDRLTKMLAELPEPELITAVPATAVDATALAIRANARVSERRLTLTEQLRRLEIDEAGLREGIEAERRAARAQQDAETEFGKVCRDIYLATLKRYVSLRRN